MILNNNSNKKRKLIVPPTSQVTNIKYDYSSSQNIGKREEQQDAAAFIDGINSDMRFDFAAVVCDGMGGMADGAAASRQTMQIVMDAIRSWDMVSPDKLIETACNASETIANISYENNISGQMGTTLLCVVLVNSQMHWCSVGDSRIYLIRNNKISMCNHDHNYMTQLVDEVIGGVISREDAIFDERGHALTSYIGQDVPMLIDISYKPLMMEKGDKIILASDGLFGTLSDDEILYICQTTNVKNLANSLINNTLRKNHDRQDNVSVVAIEYMGE